MPKISDFKGNTTEIDPYPLDLEDGSDPVLFENPHKMDAEKVFHMAEAFNPRHVMSTWLGVEEFTRAWAVLGKLPADHVEEIVTDIWAHFRK